MTGPEGLLDIVLRGNLVVPDGLLEDASVGVKGGKIIGIYQPDIVPSYRMAIDARNQYILPGAIDAHVHCLSDPAEGFTNATRSAAAGGVTTIIEMPYDAGMPVVSRERLLAKRADLEGKCVVDVALLATIRKTGGLAEIPLLAEAGACGFKVSLYETDPDRFPRIPDGELLEAFARISETGLPVGIHAENDELITAYTERYRSHGTEPHVHSSSRPRVAESSAVLKALEFAYATGVHLHIHHASIPRAFEMVDWFRAQKVSVTAETCTHYLTLSESDMERLKGKVKVNPPLRSASDCEGLWGLCAAGRVDIVTSDHAPWKLDRKLHNDMFDNASGMPGVEALVPMLFSEGVTKRRISVHDFARLVSAGPAKVFGLKRKGQITVGYDADFTIIDPNLEWTLDEKAMHSNAGWSPYHSWQMQGKVTKTIVRGQLVYDGQQVVGIPGIGHFVPGSPYKEGKPQTRKLRSE